jgi:hypothetical protein
VSPDKGLAVCGAKGMHIRYKIELAVTILSALSHSFIFAIKSTQYNPIILTQGLKKWRLKSNLKIQVYSIFEMGNIIHYDNRIVEIKIVSRLIWNQSQ